MTIYQKICKKKNNNNKKACQLFFVMDWGSVLSVLYCVISLCWLKYFFVYLHKCYVNQPNTEYVGKVVQTSCFDHILCCKYITLSCVSRKKNYRSWGLLSDHVRQFTVEKKRICVSFHIMSFAQNAVSSHTASIL